mmetsp:Transcript_3185/g.10624  ORF Transcript_3185/g.10624 Transcript_3185/m.10624 type:complete len:163 (-) Transcript_3185:46-534(-)
MMAPRTAVRASPALLLLAAHMVAAHATASPEEAALRADDECAAVSGAGCAINALQQRLAPSAPAAPAAAMLATGAGGRKAAKPSTIPGCPPTYVDCGVCRCVPPASCVHCSAPAGAGAGPEEAGTLGSAPIEPAPGYCAPGTVKCGLCQCVPAESCQWCPTR